jgi:hypothetical protein
MLLIISFTCPSGPVTAPTGMSFANRTIDNNDQNLLKYEGSWFNAVYTVKDGTIGSLAGSNDTSAKVTFVSDSVYINERLPSNAFTQTFNVPAKAFYYWGIKRCCGGKYSICIDDECNKRDFETVDAVDPKANEFSQPVCYLI